MANRVFCWKPLPSGLSSIDVTVSPNCAAHESKWVSSKRSSVSYCKYRCMVYISAIELETGVPVAKTTPLLPVSSSR